MQIWSDLSDIHLQGAPLSQQAFARPDLETAAINDYSLAEIDVRCKHQVKALIGMLAQELNKC